MTKQELLEKYQGLLTVNGMEETAKMILDALEVAYDNGYNEGLRKAIEIQNEVSKLFTDKSKLNLPIVNTVI